MGNKISFPTFSLESKLSKFKFLNTFYLKLFAIVVMTIDHVGAIIGIEKMEGFSFLTSSDIIPEDTYNLLRSIGRLAFPIFCYLIAEGFYYTRNVYKYTLRLIIFAFVSQIPYSLGIYKEFLNTHKLNVFFTLALGLVLLIIVDKCIKLYKEKTDLKHRIPLVFIALISTIVIMNFADYLNSSYEEYGVLLVLSFYLLRNKYICQLLIIGYITYLHCGNNIHDMQMLSLFALIPIWLHNGKKGPSLKYFFYLYYPLHQLALYFVYLFIDQSV